MSANLHNLRPLAVATVAAFGLTVTTVGVTPSWVASLSPIVAAHAEDGPKGPGGPTGEHGERGGKAPSEVGGRGQGQGGPSGDSDAKGPRYGGEGSRPEAGTQGGRPVWAQEGVPSDIELGRLSVVRAPSHVIDRSLATALAELQPAFYDQVVAIANNASLSLDQKIAALQTLVKDNFESTTLVRIDSPLENLGLYKDLLADGKIVAASATYDTASNLNAELLLAAVFVGSASDKTIPVSTATVDAINKILGLTLPDGLTSEQLGIAAEAVRQAIAEAHG
jgi:hypothetical protein